MIDRKHQIARAFASAVEDYDQAALVHRRVAARLARMIPPVEAGAAVEIGCGTGLLTARLLERLPRLDWQVTDLSAAMVARCAETFAGAARFRVMDGEAPDLPLASCRLIASSLAFQWFDDLPAALRRLSARLAPGGVMAFATLGEDTFAEWRDAHAALGLSCGSLRFPAAAAIQAALPAAEIRQERLAVPHPDGHAFARSLKAIGAHLAAAGHSPLAPGDFRRLLRRFAGGCTATYHVVYGVFRR